MDIELLFLFNPIFWGILTVGLVGLYLVPRNLLGYIAIPTIILMGVWGMTHEYASLTLPKKQMPELEVNYQFLGYRYVPVLDGPDDIIIWLVDQNTRQDVLFRVPSDTKTRQDLERKSEDMRGKIVRFRLGNESSDKTKDDNDLVEKGLRMEEIHAPVLDLPLKDIQTILENQN